MRPPNQTFLELTRACNFRCEHCFGSAGPPVENELNKEYYFRIFDQLFELGCWYINITGGEPLLRKDFLEILDYSRQYGEAQKHIVLTNGSLWTRKFFEEFMRVHEKQPLDVQISLDGYSYETYSAARGGTVEDYKNVVRTIGWLQDAGVPLVACFTVTKKNICNTLKTARWALEDLGLDGFHIVPLFISGRAISNFPKLAFTFTEWSSLLKDLTILKRDGLWNGLEKCISVGFFTWYELVYALKQEGLSEEIESVWKLNKEEFTSMFRKVYCEAGITDWCVMSNGDLYPCVPAIGTEFILGNVKEMHLEEIWENSPCLAWFRESSHEAAKKEPCASCEYSDVCNGGCRVSALILKKDKTAPDPRCPIVAEYESMQPR